VGILAPVLRTGLYIRTNHGSAVIEDMADLCGTFLAAHVDD
jgi:hypothetical protein